MKRARLLIALAVCFLFTPFAMADEDIAVSELPARATAAIQSKFKGATLLSAERETKKDRVVYEVKIRVGDKEKEVKVTDNGEILKVEDED